MKSISILGCGESGIEWDGQGDCIGVNDAWKFGKPTKWLLCVQTIMQMQKWPERIKTIINSKPEKFYTHKKEWERLIPQTEFLEIHRWKGRLDERIRFSRTSPFIAMIMAYHWGYDHIKLFGVDFINHKHYSPGQSKDFGDEMKNYKHLFIQLKEKGVTIKCTKESYLTQFL